MRRGIGRPANQKLSVGRETLIDAACNLLKTTPPSAITRALMARETGVDPSLIRYYFSNRHALLVAAAERLTKQYAEIVDAANEKSDGTPESLLTIRVSALVDLIADYPFFHRLLVEEIMPSDSPAAREMITQLTQRGWSTYRDIVQSGVDQGRFRPVDPDLFFGAIIGMCEFQAPAQELRGILQGEGIDARAAREEYKRFICDLIIHGIAAPGAGA